MQRSLARLRESGRAVAVEELARRLLALSSQPPRSLARPLVAAALGREAASVPDRLESGELVAAETFSEAATALELAEFVVVDLETTGLSTNRAAVLEIGAVRVSRMRLLDSFQTLVRPSRPVPSVITALTGIDDRLVERAPDLEEAMGRFRVWLDRTPSAPFVAHNARFDESFVRRDFAVLGLGELTRPVLCTRLLARRLLPELRRYALDSLSARFGIHNPARHRALGDAVATARALVEMLRLAPARAGVATLGELLALAAPGQKRPRRPAKGSRSPDPPPPATPEGPLPS